MVQKLKGKAWPLDTPLPKSGVVFSCGFDSGNLGDLTVVRDPVPAAAASRDAAEGDSKTGGENGGAASAGNSKLLL